MPFFAPLRTPETALHRLNPKRGLSHPESYRHIAGSGTLDETSANACDALSARQILEWAMLALPPGHLQFDPERPKTMYSRPSTPARPG